MEARQQGLSELDESWKTMASLHSLILVKTGRQMGWMAPAECDEDMSHYVAYVIPLDENGVPFECYECETIRTGNSNNTTAAASLLTKGQGQYSVRIADTDVWFHDKPGVDGKKLPYVGQLEHADFSRLMIEIIPEEPRQLDRLCEDAGVYIIGCDPFSHYRKDGEPLSHLKSTDKSSLVTGR